MDAQQEDGRAAQPAQERAPRPLTVHVISDSVGATAAAVARAAAAQFDADEPRIEVHSGVRDFDEVRGYLEQHAEEHRRRFGTPRMAVYYTIVDPALRAALASWLESRPEFAAVDLLTDAISAIGRTYGIVPKAQPGELRAVDAAYIRRIEALEFTIAHDDGRNPQDLPRADLVIVGVSRSSKTPTSIYLAQEGFRVANVPLDPLTDPPRELSQVDPTRLFGLVTSPDVLVGIRRRRLGNARSVAASYADPEQVARELEAARAIMRQLGCIVINTENRAVEETAQDIIRAFELTHPPA